MCRSSSNNTNNSDSNNSVRRARRAPGRPLRGRRGRAAALRARGAAVAVGGLRITFKIIDSTEIPCYRIDTLVHLASKPLVWYGTNY